MSAEDIATILNAIGDSWPAALCLIAGVIGFVAWRALPYLKDIKDKTADVHHEMYANSGKSLRDAVNRIEADGKATQEALADHLAQSAEVWQKVADLEEAQTAAKNADASE